MRIVFLHGFLGTKSDWDSVIAHLPCECTAIDLPGSGSSPPDFDLFAALDALGPIHLVGYSMGGRIALQYPGKVLSLTLLSTHMGLKTEKERAQRFLHDQKLAEEILTLPIDQFLDQWYNQPLFESLHSVLNPRELRRNQNREELALALMRYSLGKQASCWSRESLRLVGEFDEKYRELYHNEPHKVVMGAGHAIHLEKPEKVAQEIYDYVLSINSLERV